jgi:predicted nucleotidyltransferase
METVDSVKDMVKRLASRAAPECIILFGSYARGEAGEDSDVDLLVLFRSLADRRQTVTALYEYVMGMNLPKDIVAATVDEYERYKHVANTIYNAAAQHGIVVYESQA